MPTIGFIGAGNMAEAIARGLLRAALFSRDQIVAIDPSPERQRLFTEDLGVGCNGGKSPATCDVVVLATKPFVVAEAIGGIRGELRPEALIISIAAGISTRFIEAAIRGNEGGGTVAGGGAGPGPRVIRVMPNTPMLAGKGMSALARGRYATDDDLLLAERIFAAAGRTVRVSEDLMDVVTAVSGSGPAYVFYLVEVLAAAGAAAGLSEAQSSQLARETVIGAAALLDQSKDGPAELRRKVTTPGGTTQAAIETLQAGDLQGLMTQAIAAAAKRSKELGK